MTDTAAKAGPRLTLDGVELIAPHVVPAVPAPKFVLSAPTADEIDVALIEEDNEVETVAGLGDAVIEGLDEEKVGLVDTVGGASVEAAEAEANTLGQKVLPNDWTSLKQSATVHDREIHRTYTDSRHRKGSRSISLSNSSQTP